MTREVWISIRGLQNVGVDEQEPVEIVSAGTYYNRNGKHYILYDTVEEDSDSATPNMIKISPDHVELTRKGSHAVRMDFRQGIRTLTEYPTPCGPLLLGITTGFVQVSETEHSDGEMEGQTGEIERQTTGTEGQINVRMEYTLDTDGDRLADCELLMRIRSRTKDQE
ncbi:MAG: DUF1934 domain-containing protein [Lachnospiraceae bacterium]|nr:DUF1934 domain-containing protein [Lachnospiraceae bacterium]